MQKCSMIPCKFNLVSCKTAFKDPKMYLFLTFSDEGGEMF